MDMLVFKNDVGDYELPRLERYLHLLDLELREAVSRIKLSIDSESNGLYDVVESVIGHAFVDIQYYLTSVRSGLNLKPKAAFSVGPLVADGISIAEALNAAANYWKHHEEWYAELQDSPDGHLSGQGMATLAVLEKVVPWSDYTCSNFLAAVLGGDNFELSRLLPLIVQWRDNLLANVKK